MSQAADEVGVEDHGQRRLSIEKPPILSDRDIADMDDDYPSAAFDRLPEEIIQQILEAADPRSFASLVLLNSKWRSASQQARLYALQLMACPSYSASQKKVPDSSQENLPNLRKLFAREVKRNLFDAYLRPNHTIIKLVSNSISSSSCPGGDGISFTPSPNGHYWLAYNSSRINILDLRGPTIKVERELKILRRPAATCIKDDGSLLAVLLTEMQVDLYDLTHTPPRRTQSIILDHTPRAIALSPCGSVLAAAYDGGIEVQSLGSTALATDRRAVKCDGVDSLAFSFDGTQILGTTVHSAQPNTVVLTAPYYDPGSHLSSDNISALWTTSILFPNTSRDCSHAVLIQESSHEEAAWTFTYDRSFETFRAVRIDDLRNGTTYFTGPTPRTPSQARLLPCTLPAASHYGELVSAGFQGQEVWLYGVPEDLEAVPDNSNNNLDIDTSSVGVFRRVSGGSMRSRTQEAGEPRVPQWQLLCDKLRNTFVGGFKVAELSGVDTVKWVAGFGDSSLKERLVIAAKGAMPAKPITEEDDMDFEDGGRLTLVDFDYGLEDGCVTELTIEVGIEEPEVLEEEHRDMETEVAIVRRRTVAQKRGNRTAIMRAATTAAARPLPTSAEDQDDDDPLLPRRIGAPPPRPTQPSVSTEETETETETEAIIEEQEALDAPYSHTGPRSITTLRRAATAAANHRRLNPITSTGAPIEYRRADGRAEHPHESDADNWVPPPPPYQKEDPGETPVFLRHSMTPVIASAQPESPNQDMPPVPPIPLVHQEAVTPVQPRSLSSRHQALDSGRPESIHQQTPQSAAHQRFSSYPTTPTTPAPGIPVPRTVSSLNTHQEDDIYNVSPPDTPQPQASSLSSNQQGVIHDNFQGAMRRGSEPFPTLLNGSPYTGTQRVIPLVPRAQTIAASSPQTIDQPFNFEQQGFGPLQANPTWNPHVGGGSYPSAMHSQTWPIPPPGSVTPVMGATGHTNPGSHSALGIHAIDHARPVPDQPLIISTPTGVSGAYDAPTRRMSDYHSESQIIAPVPRHPRPTQNSGVLRPTAERLEGQLDPSFLTAPTAPSAISSRMSSLNRRASRAERSAAKNISDARKKGWRPGRTKSKKARSNKNEPEFDMMSQSAWTDVTWSTAGRDRNRRTYNFGAGERMKGPEKDKDKKCTVM
ncbi:hypothetical protein VP1G_01503 [Cytospora mali]|uniref:F-box domain-containing protein n=1 Tax=Cytospora mali TaxID=578113 RepID=A0A194UQJ0_CYTMA|nr:hypothetical protein VP1G_01503 [Valsa mali var. pyri (nom. inval.)]